MGRRGTITKATLDLAAKLIRRAHPEGMSRGQLAEELNVNVSTWRTGGYEEVLLARHPDLYRERGRFYNDGEKTAILLSLQAAVARGESTWASELRARWESLRGSPRGQRILDGPEEV